MNTEIIDNSNNQISLKVIDILKSIFDPEIPYSIYDIGLIYKVIINNSDMTIIMTLTSVNCPEAQTLPELVTNSLLKEFKEFNVKVDVVFEPTWTVDLMSEEILLKLGLL